MGFFTEPAFFLLLVPVVGAAVVLGVRERPLARFGCVASVLMLALLFSRSLASLAFFAGYLAYSFALWRYVTSLFERQAPARIALYRVALALQVAPLAVYKVGVVVDPDFLGFVGISYITFKTVQVLIETRDGLIRDLRPFAYLYFLVFFPTFTSGPIMRSRPFATDLDAVLSRDAYLELLYRGAGWFLLGALYKFMGAPIGQWAMWFLPSVVGMADPASATLGSVIQAVAYTLYLFFDFAGYSHMAVGLGFALGVKVPPNFRAPFLAVDIKDFWNRWHISLSTWLRDFVFMRFTAAAFEHKWFSSPVTTACLGYVLNMTLMGVWHGLTWHYLVYGLYHGVLLAACELVQRKGGFYRKHKRDRWFKACSWAVTMAAVVFGMALFSGQVLAA